MASSLLGPEDSREKQQKWADNNKVYTRKHSKKPNRPYNKSSQTAAATTEDNSSSLPQVVSQSDAAASDDSSTLLKVHELGDGGSMPGPIMSDGIAKISVNPRSKLEIRQLKRKLIKELDQVKSLLKKLESKEIRANGYRGGEGYTNSQFSANDNVGKGWTLMRENSDVGPVGAPLSRPFHGLTDSVADSSNGVGDEFLEKEKSAPKGNQFKRTSDPVASRDKPRPPESNKKMKKSNGRIDDSKSNGRIGGGGPRFGLDKHSSKLFQKCNDLLTKLMKHSYGWVFNVPVDAKKLGLHDYFTIIKHPMDLGTVKTRLTKNWYKSAREFAEDVRLTFQNAMLYNPKGQDVHVMAETLLKIFEDKWAVLEKEHNHELRYERGLPTPTSKKAPTPPPTASVALPVRPDARTLDRSGSASLPTDSRAKPAIVGDSGKTKVPKKHKAKDSHKKEMTFEEKQRLSVDLQNLPSEKLEDIVQIIKRRNPHLCQQEDEIEVDIDSVDSETLWELDSFVSNYKKSLSNKRKAEVPLEPCSGADVAAMEMVQVQVPSIVEATKKSVGGAAEKNEVKHGPPQLQKQGIDVSESSSSSSSDSDTGSSSSDSDSDRSSS